jgi:hypothetical protein
MRSIYEIYCLFAYFSAVSLHWKEIEAQGTYSPEYRHIRMSFCETGEAHENQTPNKKRQRGLKFI